MMNKNKVLFFFLLFAFTLTFTLTCYASPWSKAFVSGEKIPSAKNWTVRVERLGSWMESYVVYIQWNKFIPTLGTWDINGEPKNLTSVSPTKIVITEEWGVVAGYKTLDLNARNRMVDLTVVTCSKEPLYGFSGYIQHAEGLEIPFTILWDYDAKKARMILGDEDEEQ